MKMFDIHETRDITNVQRPEDTVISELKSDVKDAEFIRWVAVSSKMREELNQLLKITKKLIKKVEKNERDNEKLKQIIKAATDNSRDVRATLRDVIANINNGTLLSNNPAYNELNKNISRMENTIDNLCYKQGLQDSPVIADLYEKLCGLEDKFAEIQSKVTS